MTLGQWFLLSEPRFPHLQNGSRGVRVKDDCGRGQDRTRPYPRGPQFLCETPVHPLMPTHMLYWTLSHFLLQ